MSAGALARPQPPEDAGPLAAPLGMWVFLSSEVLFFGGLLLAYAWGRGHWPQGFAAASRETHVVIGTVNTALLLTSSALVALAVACAKDETQHGARGRDWVPALLAAACALGTAFMVLKGVEYAREWHEHLVPGRSFRLAGVQGAQIFFVFYFIATGLHAVHLCAGLGVLGTFAWGRHGRRRWATSTRIEAAGLYWHFVDVVWIFLYPLIYLGGRS